MFRTIKQAVRKNPRAAAGLGVLALWILLAILVPLAGPYSYSDQNADIRNQGISAAHLFGTDKFGRDLFTRVWYGAGISLLIGTASALINGMIGVTWGAAAGYVGKRTDMILMRTADIIAAVPSMLYVILLTLVMGAGAGSIILGLCISGWIDMARITRGEIMRLKQTDYAAAAEMEGIGKFRILYRHLLPNAAGPITVNLIFLVPQGIFTEAFLSFLGIGIAPPAASLGTIIQAARSQMVLYPTQMICPLAVLCVMILAFNLAGNALEDRMNGGRVL